MKKIVVLNHDPLTDRVYKSFCIDYFQSLGIDVEYVDLSNFYYPHLKMFNALIYPFVVKLYRLSDILDYIDSQNVKETVFIVEATRNWKSRLIHRRLTENNCFLVKISIYGNNSVDNSFISKLKRLSLNSIYSLIGYKLYKQIYSLKEFDLHFTSSRNASNAILINHPDYEEYLKTTKQIDCSDDYIVFLDEFFPYHPDILYRFGVDIKSCASSYYKKLNDFFSVLECTLNKDVVIAAHPKSNYIGNEFGNRKIIRGCTAKLVRQAALVVLHSSTSLSFAILNEKPVLIISCSEYRKLPRRIRYFQKEQAEVINEKVVDIDKCALSDLNLFEMDFSARNSYKMKYLTSLDTCNKTNNEIIYSKLINVLK